MDDVDGEVLVEVGDVALEKGRFRAARCDAESPDCLGAGRRIALYTLP